MKFFNRVVSVRLDAPNGRCITTSIEGAKGSWALVRIEILESGKRSPTNIVLTSDEAYAMAAKGSADDAVLGLFRYSPPDITRVVVHFYYHDANDRIQ